MPETTNNNPGGEGGSEEPTRFQLGENGPKVSAEPKLADYLQGKGDSPVGYAQSAPPNEDAKVGDEEGSGAPLKSTDRPDRDVNVSPVKRQRKSGD